MVDEDHRWASSTLNPDSMMASYLQRLVALAYERRAAEYEALKTSEQISAYQKSRRHFFIQSLGGFPERTPVNAQIVGEIKCNGYHVEKVIFESQPKHYVTAAMYVPEGSSPYPCVLVPCGHAQNGKAAELYQRACILLARNGLAAFCYDPIGQGERSQLLDAKGQARYGCTQEHTILGMGSILLGTNTARFRIYDGMRALDYICSREDVDPGRIGCTGNSGGGTLTSYLMALDQRIACAAPSCYLTTFQRLLSTWGPGDAEQDIYRQIESGMDHADYVIMRAPKPTLMCTATHDYFDITGAWDAFRQAKRIFTRLGFPERVDLAEADAPHGFSAPLRVAAVRWMRRWLLGIDDAVAEEDTPILSDEQLQCTPRGQVGLIEGARSAFQINVDLESSLSEGRQAFWRSTTYESALARVREIARVRRLDDLPECVARPVGVTYLATHRVERLILRPEDGILLPAIAFVPERPSPDAYLYLNGDGKEVDAGPGGPIDRLVKHGHIVLAVDLRGLGETVRPNQIHNNFFIAYMLGLSYIGMRTEDVLMCARFLETYADKSASYRVHLVAVGEFGLPALHAAALEPDLFSSITLRRTLVSWAELIHTPDSDWANLVNTIHGALKTYDFTDLISVLPPEKVIIQEPVGARQRPTG